jgi:Protein of unknown function (DUF2628)
MTTYTLHVPRGVRPGDPDVVDEAKLVKDGFSWGAFFFTFLWFFFQRMWLAGLLVLLALVAFGAVAALLDVRPLAASLAQLLLSFLIGIEANGLKRWTLKRRGLAMVDAVTAQSRDEAEAKLFARWLAAAPPRANAGPAYTPAPQARTPDPVIGLFPDVERPR